MVSLVVLVLLFILPAYFLWKWKIYSLLDGVQCLKGPTNYPILGSLMSVLPSSKSVQRLCAMCDDYGKTFKITIPITAAIVSIDPDFSEFVLTSQETLNKAMLYNFLKGWLGDGLLLSSSGKWKSRRKMITPTFHFKILDQFMQVFNKNGNILIDQLNKSIGQGKKTVDLLHFIALAAMDNIIETAMGSSLNTQLNEQSDYVRATKFMAKHMITRMINPITYLSLTYFFTPMYWQEKKALGILKNYTRNLIRERRQALRNNNNEIGDTDDSDSFGIKKKTAFLDLLLQATIDGQPLTDEDILEEVDTFMFEGHDTVSAGISFTLFCLARHPEIQQKILEEQRVIFGDDPNRDATSEDLKDMTYLEMVIKEGLRLFPSVPIIARNASKDFQYKDLAVRRGTTIVLLIQRMHMDPANFPNPEEFVPERFLPEEQSKRHAFCYLPFSAGYRNCVGQRFAMMEMKTTISKVCRNFELEMTQPAHECYMPSAVVLRSENGALVNMKARQW